MPSVPTSIPVPANIPVPDSNIQKITMELCEVQMNLIGMSKKLEEFHCKMFESVTTFTDTSITKHDSFDPRPGLLEFVTDLRRHSEAVHVRLCELVDML